MTTGDSPLSVTPATTALPKFKVSLAKRYQLDRLFHWVALIATLIGLVVLAVLLFHIARSGLPQVGWSFISNFASRKPEQAGIYAAVIGTIWLMMVTAAIAFPFGVGAGMGHWGNGTTDCGGCGGLHSFFAQLLAPLGLEPRPGHC